MHSIARAVAGAQLFAAVTAGALALANASELVTTPTKAFSCCLAAATCVVAYYHYAMVHELRKSPVSGSQNDEVAAVRLSDWAVTLPGLVVELHLLNNFHTGLFPIPVSILFVEIMVACGVFTRFYSTGSAYSIVAYLVGFACCVVVIINILYDLQTDATNGYVAVFVLPWLLYGIQDFVYSISAHMMSTPPVRPANAMQPRAALNSYLPAQTSFSSPMSTGYQNTYALQLMTDIVYGLLDVHCKAVFAIYVAMSSIDNSKHVFPY